MRADAVSYSCAITACQRSGQADLALQLFDEMLLVPQPGYLCIPSLAVVVTWAVAMQQFILQSIVASRRFCAVLPYLVMRSYIVIARLA